MTKKTLVARVLWGGGRRAFGLGSVALLLIVLVFPFLVSDVSAYQAVYESYTTGSDALTCIFDNNVSAQSFTAVGFHVVNAVSVAAARTGSPGDLVVQLRTVNSQGYPDVVLASNSCATAGWTQFVLDWRVVNFSGSVVLSNNVQYAIVFSAPDGDGSNTVDLGYDSTSASYSGGCRFTGLVETWVKHTSTDFLFKIQVFGVGWIQTHAVGNSLNRTVFHSVEGEDFGYSRFAYSPYENYTGYSFAVNLTEFYCSGFTWYGVGEKRFWVVVDVVGADGSNVTMFYTQRMVTNTWGLLWDRAVMCNVRENQYMQEGYTGFVDHGGDWGIGWKYIEDYVVGVSENFVTFSCVRVADSVQLVALFHGDGLPVVMCNVTVVKDNSWFESAGVFMHVKHEGSGVVEGVLSDVFNATAYSGEAVTYSPLGFWEQLQHDIASLVNAALPGWGKDFVVVITGMGAWTWDLLGVLSSIVVSMAPLFGFFLLMYVVDAFATSASQGSFTPIGVCFSSLYQGLASVASVVVSIGQAIAQFIHFW